MENTNPWLEITKQKESPLGPSWEMFKQEYEKGFADSILFGLPQAYHVSKDGIKSVDWHEMLHQAKEFQNPTVESDYEQGDIDFVVEMINDYNKMPSAEFCDEYFQYFTVHELDNICERIERKYNPIDIIDYLYAEEIWYKT